MEVSLIVNKECNRMESPYKKLGVIGGLGPAATVYLYDQLVSLTDAAVDQEHLDITILNRPQTPDRTAFLLGESDRDFTPCICAAARDLVGLGCEIICVPCVTAHAAHDAISDAALPAHLVSLPDVVADDLAAHGCRHIGIMATAGTVATGFLQRTLEARGMTGIAPDAEHQALVTSIIFDEVKAGAPVTMSKFERVCDHLLEKGCDSVVLGCTELPLIHAPNRYHGMYIADSLKILARRSIEECGARVRPMEE